MEDISLISRKLIQQLYAIPFPFHSTVQQQISAAHFTCTSFPDLFRIHFRIGADVPLLPEALDHLCLSWQIIPYPGGLYNGYLYARNGYIETLEIMDCMFEEISWDKVWAQPSLITNGQGDFLSPGSLEKGPIRIIDYDYSEDHIFELLASPTSVILESYVYEHGIDWVMKDECGRFKLCFRSCNIRHHQIQNNIPLKPPYIGKTFNGHTLQLRENDSMVDFDFSLAFISYC